GKVLNTRQTWDQSTANVTDGSVDYLYGKHNSHLIVSGGEIGTGGVEAVDHARATVNGGTLGSGVTARGHAILSIKGGYVPFVSVLGYDPLANISASICGPVVGRLYQSEGCGQDVGCAR